MSRDSADREDVSFTDVEEDAPAGGDKQATGSAMMDLISGLQKQKGSSTSGGDSTTSGSTGRGKKKKKGKKGKKVTKRKRRKDRYESQNYLLRIEGTLCCASIGEPHSYPAKWSLSIDKHKELRLRSTISVISLLWLVSCFIVFIICGIWSGFDFTATTDSVKQ